MNQIKTSLDADPDETTGEGARVHRTLQVVQTRASLSCLADELERLWKQTASADAGPKKARAPRAPRTAPALNGEGPGLASPKRRGRPPKLAPLEAVANE
jgi:hypothetical protein